MFIASPTGIVEYDFLCDVYSWMAVIFFHSCALLFVSFFTFYRTQSCMATDWDTGYIKIDCNRTKSWKSSLVIMNQLTKLNTSFLPCHRIFFIVLWCCIILLLAACNSPCKNNRFSTYVQFYKSWTTVMSLL